MTLVNFVGPPVTGCGVTAPAAVKPLVKDAAPGFKLNRMIDPINTLVFEG
jgi:hypothetical protein